MEYVTEYETKNGRTRRKNAEPDSAKKQKPEQDIKPGDKLNKEVR